MAQTLRRWSVWAIIISLAVFSCAVAVSLSPARGQGNPGAKRRAPAPPSPEETTLRSRAIREAVEQCAALVEAGDHRRAVPMLADLRRALAKQAKGEDDSARMAARELPRVDALVARVALDAKAPDKALDFVRPYVEPRDAYNPDHADCYLVAGDACSTYQYFIRWKITAAQAATIAAVPGNAWTGTVWHLIFPDYNCWNMVFAAISSALDAAHIQTYWPPGPKTNYEQNLIHTLHDKAGPIGDMDH